MTKKEKQFVKEQLKLLFNKFIEYKKEYKAKPSSVLEDIEMAKQEAKISGLLDFIIPLYSNGIEILDPEDLYPMLDALKANTEIL